MSTNRREFIKKSAAGVVGIVTVSVPQLVNASKLTYLEKEVSQLNLGVASYSFRKFSQKDTIDMTVRCGLDRIAFKSMHLPLNSDKETMQKTLSLCKEKGVELYGGGVIYMKTKDEVDQAFTYAKNAQMDVIIGVPNHELLEYVEKKVIEYDIKIAIHNHGPGDKLYPSAESIFRKIENMDKRMGLCIDIGHTKRIGKEPTQDVTDFFDRVYDIHLKDVTSADAEGKPCIIGRGVIDFQKFLNTVVKLNYKGTLAFEYEAEEYDPLAGMAESVGYVKGILSTI